MPTFSHESPADFLTQDDVHGLSYNGRQKNRSLTFSYYLEITMPEKTNMVCPHCQTFQALAETCNKCGVIIEKARMAAGGTGEKLIETKSGKPPIAKSVVILLVAIPCIGLILYLATGDKNEAVTTADSKEQQKTNVVKPIDRIAAFNPAIANNIQRNNVMSKLQSLKVMLYSYGVEGDEPPSNEEGLQTLVDRGYLAQPGITDEWGNTFVYRLEWGKETPWGKEYKIFVHSKGPDGISGNADDVMMP